MPGWSPYNYTFNNPVSYTDPDGRFPVPIITGLIGAAGGLIYGLASGKNWKQTLALTGGGFVAGATMGLGGSAIIAAGGAEVLSTAGVMQITMFSGVVSGLAGNAAEQGIRMGLGEAGSKEFNQVEFVMSGAFGIAEPAFGVAGDAIQNSVAKGIRETVFMPNRAQQRRAVREATGQIRAALGPGRGNKRQAKRAAKQLVQAAVDNRSSTLEGVIKFNKGSVDVQLSALQQTAVEETKTKVIENDKK